MAGAAWAGSAAAQDRGYEVHVIQKKTHTVTNRLELTPLGAFSLNNKFTSSIAPGIAIGYHFSERLAIEGSFLYSFSSESNLTSGLRSNYAQAPRETDRRQLKWLSALNATVVPFNGKLALFNQFNIQFDFYLTAGVGLSDTFLTDIRDPKFVKYSKEAADSLNLDYDPVAKTYDGRPIPGSLRLTGNFGGGFRVFAADWMAVRLEIRDYLYGDEGVANEDAPDAGKVTDVNSTIYFMLGLSFFPF
ncbi:MAG: hypothetical protein GMKNLPBB_01803 [Myxococcota bacterium]|nr:hypothetical protein [Myxococcota bacterium]